MSHPNDDQEGMDDLTVRHARDTLAQARAFHKLLDEALVDGTKALSEARECLKMAVEEIRYLDALLDQHLNEEAEEASK